MTKPASQLALVVNGRTAPRVEAIHEGVDLMIALEPALDALGFAHRRDGDDRIVDVSGSSFTLSPGSHIARQDGTEALQLVFAPVVHDQMYVAPSDLAKLLSVDIAVDGTRISVASDEPADAEATVEERPVARTHAPDSRYARSGATPVPSATAAPVAFVGRVGLTLVDTAGQQSRLVSLQGAGDTVRGSIAAQGSDGSSSVNGSIFLGDQHRSTTLGAMGDPLGGTVFQSSGATGFAFARSDGRLNYSDALRVDGTRMYAFENRQRFGSSEIALAESGGRFDQLLVGERLHRERPGFVYAADAWASTRGFAAGLTAKTTGKLFLQGTAAAASGELPLQTGDVARELSLGYKVSPALTFSGGAFSALGIPSSAFTAASLRTAIGSFGISNSRTQTTLTADAMTPARFVALNYTRAAGESSASLNAASAARRGALEFSGQSASDHSGDAGLRWRTERTGPSLVAGIERIWSDGVARLGAIAGVAFPLFSGLSVEAAIHPLQHGNGLRITLVQDVVKHRRVPTERVALHLLQPAGAGQVWVDGAPFSKLNGTDGTVDVPAGSTTVAVRSLDGRFGSPTVNLTGRTTAPIALPMWPIRVVHGRIAVEIGNPVDALISLEHTIVTLESSDIVTEVRADGTFEMSPQPLPPGAVVRIDEDTLPDAFSAGPAVAASPDGETILTIHGRRAVERKTF